MTYNQVSLAAVLLREHFGDTVEKVGRCLMKHGSLPRFMIVSETGKTLEEVKKALCVLIQHNFAVFAKNSKGVPVYTVDVEVVLLLLRYPRYIYCAKTLYADIGEIIIEELLRYGQLLMSDAIEKSVQRLSSNTRVMSGEEVHEKFVSLVQTQFIQRCPQVVETSNTPTTVVPHFETREKELFDVPNIPVDTLCHKRKRSADNDLPPAKRSKPAQGEEGIYWRVNFDRFHQFFRDQAIVSAVAYRIDTGAGEVMRTMLRMSEVSSESWDAATYAIAKYDLCDTTSRDVGLKPMNVEQYLAVLVDDPTRFVTKVGDSQGGMYQVNMKETATSLAWATVETVIQERFGSKCLRIFRLLRLKKYLEQKQIEEMAMIPPKDAKDMTYSMFQENFIQVQEVPRTPDYAPARTFFLFHVDLSQVARMLLDRCYKAIFNAKLKSEFEIKENKRTLDKKRKVDAIATSLRSQGADETQLQEIEEMITPPERALLERVKMITNKLEMSELQLDETVFVMQTYIRYLKSKN